jgi:hypothetical protein
MGTSMRLTAAVALTVLTAGRLAAQTADVADTAAGVPLIATAAVLLPIATARVSSIATPGATVFRLPSVVAPLDRSLRFNDPESRLRPGYAGMVDLFPLQGGAFRVSGGSRLWSRTGRWRWIEPESLRYLQPFRYGSLRASRQFRPALLVGYGRTVDRGLSLGIDAGLVKGKIGTMPDRLGRLNRERLNALGGRAMRPGMNELVRMTGLYRF